VIDSFNKKTILISVDILRFLIVFCVFLSQDVWFIYLLTFVNGIAGSFFIPTSHVFIVHNGKETARKKFNSIMSTVNSGAMLTAPALAGIIISAFSIDTSILITSLLFLFCAICIAFISNAEEPKEIKKENFPADGKGNFIFRDLKFVRLFFKQHTTLLIIFILFHNALMIGFALDSQEAT
jgi:MFS family permease